MRAERVKLKSCKDDKIVAQGNPPTQAEVQALADKLDELINTLSA